MIYSFDKLTFEVLSVDRYEEEDGLKKVAARPFFALAFREEGEAKFRVGSECFVSKKGDLTFIPKDTSYEVEYENSKAIVFHFSDCNYFHVENITPIYKDKYKLFFERALLNWKENLGVFGAKASVYRILQNLIEEKTIEHQTSDKLFFDCVKYIKEHFCDGDLSLESVCEKFFVSAATVRRKFHQYYQTSYVKFVADLRFDKAFTMLNLGKEKISTIAYACGFKDEKYFSRAIKNRFGITPKDLTGR